jgi:hypothetical protein
MRKFANQAGAYPARGAPLYVAEPIEYSEPMARSIEEKFSDVYERLGNLEKAGSPATASPVAPRPDEHSETASWPLLPWIVLLFGNGIALAIITLIVNTHIDNRVGDKLSGPLDTLNKQGQSLENMALSRNL